MYKINNTDEIRNSVKEEYEKFDLEKFLTGNSVEGAVILVTDKQIVMNDCFSYGDNWRHEDILKKMYKAIYGANDNKNADGWSNFEANVADDGNICLCFIVGDINTALVFLPRNVTNGQYELMEVLNDKIKEIYSNNSECFMGKPLIFTFDDNYNSINSFNNLDKVLDSLKKRIKDNNNRDEIIIGDTIDSFKQRSMLGNVEKNRDS